MEFFVGILGLTGLALASWMLLALHNDSWAIRTVILLIARRNARMAYREAYKKDIESMKGVGKKAVTPMKPLRPFDPMPGFIVREEE